MNRIVREHYPAAKLPEELRQGLDASGRVTVTVVEEQRLASPEELVELLRQARQRIQSIGGISMDEAVARIRDLRDEWDA